MLNTQQESPDRLPQWLSEYPVTLIQIVCYLYHNVSDFNVVFMTEDVCSALVSTVFPVTLTSSSTSGRSSQASVEKEDTMSPEESSPVESIDDSLSAHPARRHVLQLMRILIVDSLSLEANAKTAPVIDLFLDAKPIHTTKSQQHRLVNDNKTSSPWSWEGKKPKLL